MMQLMLDASSKANVIAPVLDVRNLSVSYGGGPRPLRAVRNISFEIKSGEALGLIGESGSGKTTVAFAVMRHVSAEVTADRIAINGQDMARLSNRELRDIRGRKMSMVYQDPMNALNPILTVGEQLAEVVRRHNKVASADVRHRVAELFAQVRLPNPERIGSRYPHQLSGGQQQRVVIAMAIACEPDLLIMDEPTTGLDVTTEAVILDLIADLRKTIKSAVLFISHNLSVVAEVCDRVGVLYAGQLVEEGPVSQIINQPRHPYTAGLIGAMPRTDVRQPRLRSIRGRLPNLRDVPTGCIFKARCDLAFEQCDNMPALNRVSAEHASRCHLSDRADLVGSLSEPVLDADASEPVAAGVASLQVSNVSKTFAKSAIARWIFREPPVHAIVDASFEIPPGKTLAVVGESGSGKSTLALCIAGLMRPDAGSIGMDNKLLPADVRRRKKSQQQAIQFIFQNPESSLNPFHSVFEIVSRPIRLYERLKGEALRKRVVDLLEMVKLDERYAARRPLELSGGEKQRVCIARAFAARPQLIVCDEPTSALDISVQAAILNQLNDLQRRFGTSYLFISHDLAAVRQVADQVVVMNHGRIVEHGSADQIFSAPSHTYTKALLAAAARRAGSAV